MKRIIFAAFAAAALIGCSNDKQVGVKGQNADNAIGFRTVTSKPTRATETDALNIRDFKVFGLWDDGTTGANYNFMYNVTVTRQIDDTWTYAPIRYWPSIGSDVDFYAYSPAGSRGVTAIPTKDSDQTTISYTVPTAANLQEDFLVAKNDIVINGATEVALQFNHVLSQLVFEARSGLEDVIFHVESIEITNLNSTGELDLNGSWTDLSGAGQNYQAAIQTIPVLFDYNDPDISTPDNGTYVRISGPNDGLMVLPQEISSCTLEVVYSAQLSSGAFISENDTASFSLASLGSFAMGTKYIFQLTLTNGVTPIVFDVDVTPWANNLP